MIKYESFENYKNILPLVEELIARGMEIEAVGGVNRQFDFVIKNAPTNKIHPTILEPRLSGGDKYFQNSLRHFRANTGYSILRSYGDVVMLCYKLWAVHSGHHQMYLDKFWKSEFERLDLISFKSIKVILPKVKVVWQEDSSLTVGTTEES